MIVNLQIRTTEETRELFLSLCKQRRMTASELIWQLMRKFVKVNPKPVRDITSEKERAKLAKGGSTSVQIHVTKNQLEAIDRHAQAEGFFMRSRWLSAVIYHALDQRPTSSDTEIAALWASNREIAVISRQLIAVGRSLYEIGSAEVLKHMDMLLGLETLLAEHQAKVAAVMDASLNRRRIKS